MSKVWRVAFALAIVGTMAFGTASWAKRPGGGGGTTGCPKDFACADVWDPVICSDGLTYSNQCYADRACAPGPCVPGETGPDPVEY